MIKREQEIVTALFEDLVRSPLKSFPVHREKIDAPNEQGVYIIYGPREVVLHVGRTPYAKSGIAQRLRNHMAGASSFTVRHLERDGSKLRHGHSFRCLVVEDQRHRALLEAYATGRLCPAHIGHGERRLKA